MLEKSWQFIHFAPSWSQLMSDCWDPPSLMLYSFESALLWKKFLSFQIREKYFCIQLLAVTCLPFFRALAWCHLQALLQTSFPSAAALTSPMHNCLQCPHNINTKKGNTANPALLGTASEIFSCSKFFFISFLPFLKELSALMSFPKYKILWHNPPI